MYTQILEKSRRKCDVQKDVKGRREESCASPRAPRKRIPYSSSKIRPPGDVAGVERECGEVRDLQRSSEQEPTEM